MCAILACGVGFGWLALDEHLATPPKEPRPRPAPYYAYLVLHLDTRQSPPTVVFADVYSAKGQDLTRFGHEANVDLYRVSGSSFHEASEELEQIIPLYFPWVMPLRRRR
jgi:hypothetical protein